jgi:hypothetical protein
VYVPYIFGREAPLADYTGFDFWLNKLNQLGGNFQDAEMVKAFLFQRSTGDGSERPNSLKR